MFILFTMAGIRSEQVMAQCGPFPTAWLNTPNLELNLVTDFGADPTGVDNAFKAFQCASKWIRDREGDCILRIPAGTYTIRTQDVPGYPNENVLNITNLIDTQFPANSKFISQVQIVGDPAGGTQLFFQAGMRYGYYLNSTPPWIIQNGPGGELQTPKNFINIEGADNIIIRDLHVYGGNQAVDTGGYKHITNNVGACFRSIESSGLAIKPKSTDNAENITAEHCTFSNFCFDGVYIGNGGGTAPRPKNITLSDVVCERNGRQGMSVTAVETLTVNSCKFNYTSAGSVLKNTPACGIDFEANGANPGTPMFENVHFTDCEAIGNLGSAMTLLPYNNGNDSYFGSDITFTRCRFGDYDIANVDNHSNNVEASAKKLLFEQCIFEGLVEAGYKPTLSTDAMVFRNCWFSDRANEVGDWRSGNYLFRTKYDATQMHFDHCEFTAFHYATSLIKSVATPPVVGVIDTGSYHLFTHCTFLHTYNAGLGGEANLLIGNRFDGNTRFLNLHPDIKKMYSSGLLIRGNANTCAANQFETRGFDWTHGDFYSAGAVIPVGENVQANSIEYPGFFIGPDHNGTKRAQWRFSRGQMELAGNVQMHLSQQDLLLIGTEGKATWVADEISNPAGVVAYHRANNNPPPADNFALDNLNYTAGNDSWFFIDDRPSAVSTSGLNLNGQCLQGGNALFTTPVACSTLYRNLLPGKYLQVLYNVDLNNGCGGACSILIRGGSGNYSVSLDGNAVNPANFTLGSGDHELLVSDLSTSCFESFHLNPAIQWLSPDEYRLGCDPAEQVEVQAKPHFPNATVQYALNGGVPNADGKFTIASSGIYTVTVTASWGNQTCSLQKEIRVIRPSGQMCCAEPLVSRPSVTLMPVSLSTANDLYALGSPVTGKTFLIDGIFTVDQSVQFEDCNFYFTPQAQMVLSTGVVLSMKRCTLQSACDNLWKGLLADNPAKSILLDECLLRDMQEGVVAALGAPLTLTNNTFTDNETAAQLRNTPAGYVSGWQGNLGVVTGNTFTSSGTGPLYLSTVSNPAFEQSQYGLKLIGCAEVQIGTPGTIASGNLFRRISTGIDIAPTELYPNALYELWYNRFTEIREHPGQPLDLGLIFQNTYSTPAGTGVHIHRMKDPVVAANWWSSTTPLVKITGHPTHTQFAHCDKAIMGHGAGVYLLNNRIVHSVAGLMMNDAHYQNYLVSGNTMEYVMAGVQLIGDLHTAKVQNNSISLRDVNDLWQTPSPMAIDVRYWTNLHNGQTDVSANVLEVPGTKGVGIHLYKTGPMAHVDANTINFTTQNATPDNPNLAASRELHGILSMLGAGNQIRCNVVNGHQQQSVRLARRTSALTMNWSRNHEVFCNQVNNTRFGAQFRGDCLTDSLLFRGNIFNNHSYGLATMPGILQEGDLGDIGDVNQDNNNIFGGVYESPQNQVTYRLWQDMTKIKLRYIYTTQQFSNGSNYLQANLDAAFELQTPSGLTFTCQGNAGCGQQWEIVSPVNLDEGLALDIAEDSVQFYFFPEMSQWAAQFQLYCDLERDSLLRASNAILNSFYQTQRYQTLGLLRTVEQKISLLSDSSSRADSLLFMQRLQDAKAANQMVNSNEGYVLNEKWANEVHLKVIEFGHDTLSTEEIEQIYNLAHSCPAVNGLGVYLARYLNAFYEPLAEYHDYQLCNAAAKGGQNVFDFVERFLNDPAGYQESTFTTAKDSKQIIAFPVPATETLCFQSEHNRSHPFTIILYDLSGKEVCKREWLPDEPLCTIVTSHLSNGMYFYSVANDGEAHFGKVIIQK